MARTRKKTKCLAQQKGRDAAYVLFMLTITTINLSITVRSLVQQAQQLKRNVLGHADPARIACILAIFPHI